MKKVFLILSVLLSACTFQTKHRGYVFPDNLEAKLEKITNVSDLVSEIVKNIEVMKLDMAKSEPLIQEIDVPRYPLENDKKGKVKTGIKYGFVVGFLAIFALCGIHFFQKLNSKEETENSFE